MDVPSCKATGGGAGVEADGISEAYACVLHACLFARLAPADAEDVAQDLFLWLFSNGPILALPAMPWLAAAAHNFVRRHWRGSMVRRTRESQASAAAAAFRHGNDGAEAVEIRLSLDRMERGLPKVEAKLLHLVRRGCTFSEAVRRLGIPRGSRSFFRQRLIGHLAVGLRAPGRREGVPKATGRLSP